MFRILALTSAIVLSLVALGPPAHALELSGDVGNYSDLADYEVWLVTNLDLTDENQPAARASVDPTTKSWTLRWEGEQPYWLLLRERFAPSDGPAFDLFLPLDLLPSQLKEGDRTRLEGIDPGLLMTRDRVRTDLPILLRLLIIVLGVLGAGIGLRFLLRKRRGPEGTRSAPLGDVRSLHEPSKQEHRSLLGILAIALLLRMQGMVGESLDLLEVSYLPGIGRPSPFAEGVVGFAAIPRMLGELAQLYCLDLVHPPLYHFVLGVMHLLGKEEWLLRLPGLVASLTTCWLLWKLMRRWGSSVGLGVAAAYACTGPSIYFGQDATPYALVGLIAVASLTLMLQALERGRTRDWAYYFLVITAGFFSHYNLAILGIAELIALLVMAWNGREDRRWFAALHRSMGPALAIAPLPLFWVWFHLSTFPTVAQDTRLVADTYAPDPGWFSFLWDFFSVNSGLDAGRTHWAAAAAGLLVLLGSYRCLRSGRGAGRRGENHIAGLLLLTTFLTFLVSVAFFYINVKGHLGGRVFYGFRWVGWSHPLLVSLVVLGILRGALHPVIRALLAALWLVGMGLASWTQVSTPSRPDYAAVSNFIRQNLEDRDAVATLPAWFQRGNLSHYFMSSGPVGRQPNDGEGVWLLDGKRVVIEAIHPSLPFETTARNSHYKRLWVAKVDERMSGRSKFSESIADQALEWSDKNLVLKRRWTDRFARIDLALYEIPNDTLVPAPGTEWVVASDQTVLNHRTYPSTGEKSFVPADALSFPDRLGHTVALQSPMTPGCVDWPFRGLRESLQPEAPNHWYLLLRIPKVEGRLLPLVKAISPAQISVQEEAEAVVVRAVGGPCSGPPLRVKITF